MPQDSSGSNQAGFDLHEKTQQTGEIFGRPYEATSGFAQNELIGGTYRVLEFLGEGGMGLVYRVEHVHMNKILALKVLKTEHLSENLWKRFRLEAQAISRLEHANIIRIYDMNQTPDGRPFYTMELLSGQSLADYLQEHQRLAARQALPIFRQVCSALAYAHERGIIHRDIKPGNIMLLNEGGSSLGPRVKIVDFGIVKLMDSGEQIGQGLTRQGEIFGSPLYMSPEQCAGSKLDARADMYSVGVTLFQALAGRPPLVGRTAAETTIMHHTTEPPSMSEVAGIEFPRELENVVAKMLAKDPADRYPSLSDVASILLTLEGSCSKPTSTASGTFHRRQTSTTPPTRTSTSSSSASSIGSSCAPRQNREADEVGPLRETHGLKALLALAATFTVLAVLVIVLLDANLLSNKAKPKAARPLASSINHTQNRAVIKKEEAAELDAVEVSATTESEKEIERLLRERKEPYFKIDKNGVSRFSFPGKVSIGVVGFADGGRRLLREAQGDFRMGRWSEISFSANQVTVAHPELLKFFPNNSLSSLKFLERKTRSAILIDQIVRQQNLYLLDLSDTAISESDFKTIASLKKLRTLSIDSRNISQKVLFESGLLARLEGVGLIGLSNCTPVLEALLASKKLEFLTLTSAKLTKRDFAIISKMTRLKHLWLNGTKLDDSDLGQLAKLQNLEYVNFYATNITARSVPILRKFRRIKLVTLPPAVDAAYFDTL
ncbi:serine/threonine protein kinase [bacterium]|nr:serine/threonine protein kinase [bacterium]MBP9806924.1 serine/threonine protein kinase [bacterium]